MSDAWEPLPEHDQTQRGHRARVLGYQADMTFEARCRSLGINVQLALMAPAQTVGEHELARRMPDWRR